MFGPELPISSEMTDALPPDDVDAVLGRPLPDRPIFEQERSDDEHGSVIPAIMLDPDYERAIQQHLAEPFVDLDLQRQLVGDLSATRLTSAAPALVVVPPMIAEFVRTCGTALEVLSYADIEAGSCIDAVVTVPCPASVQSALRPTPASPVQEVSGDDWNWGTVAGIRERRPDGTIVNAEGSVIAQLDPDLVSRMEAAKDEQGAIHDTSLANEYFEALQKQGKDTRRRNGWPAPSIEQGKVFPSAGEGQVLDFVEDEQPS